MGPEAWNSPAFFNLGDRVKPELFSVFPLLLCWTLVDDWTLVLALIGLMGVKEQKSKKVDFGMKITFCCGLWA